MDEANLTCPRCDTALAPFSAFENKLHRCETCEGLWVPITFVEALAKKPELRTRLRPLAERSVGAGVQPSRALGKPAYCAECRAKLDRFEAGGSSKIFLDRCRAHGTWFDKDELGRVVAFLQANPKAEVVTAEPKREKKQMPAHPSRPAPGNDDGAGSDAADIAVGVLTFIVDIFF